MNLSKFSNQELLLLLAGEITISPFQGLNLPANETLALQPLFSGAGHSLLHQKCSIARELVKRWLHEELQEQCLLTRPEAVLDFLGVLLGGKEHECFVVLFLDAQNRLIEAQELFRGTLTQTAVYPREVVKAALALNAAAVILAHNHPSGMATPSEADRQLTESLAKALALVDVRVHDHFIIGGGKSFSFAERGLL
jgi:DNA repair protein RadC